jgi:pimeloyl-ACP methyl ester carboxylesterase
VSTISSPTPVQLTVEDVMHDLEVGRSLPLVLPDDGPAVTSRPRAGGPSFLRSYLAARLLGRLHPRLARPALLRLWLTPWVHPAATSPVADLPAGLEPWSLRTPGGLLRGFTGGMGPTVVLVHGWAGRAADWRHLAPRLVASGNRVVAVDLPAHGASAGRHTDLFRLGRALAAVLDHERPEAVVVHSLGFPTTLLAVEAGAPEPPTLVALAPGRALSQALDRFGRTARLRPALVAELRVGIEDRFGADVWDVLDVDRALGELGSHGLVVHDHDDEEVPVTDGREIADGWSRARFVATDGLGHRRLLRDDGVHDLVVEAVQTAPLAAG